MSQNIWQVDLFSDLVGFLKNGNTNYIVLSLVIKNTPSNIKAIIKKFIKRKAEMFPNVMFLFYTVQPQDINKICFIKDDPDLYPIVCYIETMSNEVMISVEGIDGIESLDESWNMVEKKFISNLKQQSDKKISEKSYKSLETHNIQSQNFSQVDKFAEQKKLMKKLTYLKQKADEYTFEFMEDCRLRKKEEEKMLKKQQSKNK